MYRKEISCSFLNSFPRISYELSMLDCFVINTESLSEGGVPVIESSTLLRNTVILSWALVLVKTSTGTLCAVSISDTLMSVSTPHNGFHIKLKYLCGIICVTLFLNVTAHLHTITRFHQSVQQKTFTSPW